MAPYAPLSQYPSALNPFTPPAQAAQQSSAWVFPHQFSYAAWSQNPANTYRWAFDEALRHNPYNALAMERDCFVWGALFERYLPVIQMGWRLRCENPKESRQKEGTARLEKVIRRTPNLQGMLFALQCAVWPGRYGVQHITEQQRIEGADAWVIRDHYPVNGDKLQYTVDGIPCVNINPMAIGQFAPGQLRFSDRSAVLPLDRQNLRDRFIIHKFISRDADYFEYDLAGQIHGVGLRNMVYWMWWTRDQALQQCLNFMNKFGSLGLWIIPYLEGNATSEYQANQIAANMNNQAAILVGVKNINDLERHKPQLVPANSQGVDALMRFISDYFERHINRLINGQDLSSQSAPTGLGSGVASFQMDTKSRITVFDCVNLQETLSRDLVLPMQRFNDPTADYRVWWEFVIPDATAQQRLSMLQTARTMGARVPERDVHSAAGVSEIQDDDIVLGGQEQTDPLSKDKALAYLGRDGTKTRLAA